MSKSILTRLIILHVTLTAVSLIPLQLFDIACISFQTKTISTQSTKTISQIHTMSTTLLSKLVTASGTIPSEKFLYTCSILKSS